jgi:hypothetical protein
MKGDYMVYRTNFLFIWIAFNLIFFFGLIHLISNTDPTDLYSGKINWLTGYALFLAAIVMYRVIFAALYIASWKFTFCFAPRYKHINKDLSKTDVNEMIRTSTFNVVEKADEDAETTMLDKSRFRKDTVPDVGGLDLSGERPHRYDDPNDPDYDVSNFGDAQVEEVEDVVRNKFRDGN